MNEGAVPDNSIRNILGLLPSGDTSGTMTLDEVGRYLADHCNQPADIQRNRRHTLRDELFHDGGDQYMTELVHQQFKDPQVRDLRKAFVPYAKFNNALKRIVNELSTVYAEPAKRRVGKDNDKYQKALDAIAMDEQMLQASRLLNLHRALLIGPRVRLRPDGKREPLIQIATPSIVRAVLHPNDSTEVVGWMIRTDFRTKGILSPPATQAGTPTPDRPAWTLWTDVESMFLREDMTVIGSSYKTHPLGVIPWVPVSLEPPCPGFWPGMEGEDLVAAHIAIWFANILQLKETKSATKVPVIKGDGTNMARAQAADSEVPTELADGQSLETVDLSMDTQPFRDTADHILENAGHNYGLAKQVLTHAGVQSAQARELLRQPLKERRKQQQMPLRRFETRFVVVLAAVLKADMPELAFDPDGFYIEFGEPEMLLSPADDHNLFLSRREAGLDTTVAQLMRLHPGMTQEQAEQLLEDNINAEEARILLMRPAAAASGKLTGGNNNGGGAPPAAGVAPLGEVVIVPPEEKDSAPKGSDAG